MIYAIVFIIIVVLVIVLSKKDNASSTVDNNKLGNNEIMNYDVNAPFLMEIEDVFTITGRGTVVTGRISSGTIKLNDVVKIDQVLTTTIAGIEMFRKQLDSAQAGDVVGLLLKDIDREQIIKGQKITKE